MTTDLFDDELALLADKLDHYEKVRIAAENQLRIATRAPDKPDADGICRGWGFDDDEPLVEIMRLHVEALAATEHERELELVRRFRTHPLHPFVKATNGLGEKTIARLLGEIGDPYWHPLKDRPRTEGELFAYCGVAGPGFDRVGGTAKWNRDSRTRLWNIVQPIVKNRASPYRAVYDAGRERYAGAIHTETCKRCGPSGKPAQPGSPLSKSHQDARAQRLIMREILRDLWTAAKYIHEPPTAMAA